MRDIFKKAMTGAMIAGAALTVAACGGTETAATNNTMMEMDATDPMMDGMTNDVTAVDAGTMDGNMAMDTNMTMDANMMANDMMMNDMAMNNMTNGM